MSKLIYTQIIQALSRLGMSDKEALILYTLLKFGPLTGSNVARKSNIPRSSAILLLDKLLHVGYIEKIKVGGHFEYRSHNIQEITAQAESNIREFKDSIPLIGQHLNETTTEESYFVYNGEQGYIEAYNQIFTLSKGERVYVIEGKRSASFKLALRDTLIRDWQQRFKKSGIIMEAFGTLESINEIKNKKPHLIEDHRGRMVIFNELPQHICNFALDIIALHSGLIILDSEKLSAIHIKNNELGNAMRQICEGLRLISSKKNINEAY